jgi:hypothetical protein
MEDIALKEVPARLASFILQLVESEGVMTAAGPNIPTRYTHRQLATMIHSKRETVELERRRIHVKDIEILKRIASEGLHPILISQGASFLRL